LFVIESGAAFAASATVRRNSMSEIGVVVPATVNGLGGAVAAFGVSTAFSFS
jgi:hypothetical protein